VKKKPAPKPKRKAPKTSGKPGRRAGPKAAAGRGVVPARARHAELTKPVSSSPQEQREALAAARAAIDAALAKKALLPVLIDVSGRASYADYIAIVSGRSDRQVEAIADHVSQAMRERADACLAARARATGAGPCSTSATWCYTCSITRCGRYSTSKACGSMRPG